ncbi:MAG TPA: MFS transporter [Limnochordales bacterium]
MASVGSATSSVLRVCVTTVFLMLGGNLVSPILPLYGRTFGVSVAVVGLLVSAFGAARLFVDLPGGQLADRLGSRATMLAGCLVVAGSAVMAAVATSFPVLVLARALQGAGSALYMVAGYSFVGRVSPPDRRGRMMSYYQGSVLMGQSLGPTVGGFAAEHFGLASPFWFYAALAAVAAVLTVTAVPDAARERALALARTAAMAQAHRLAAGGAGSDGYAAAGAPAATRAAARRRQPAGGPQPGEPAGAGMLLRRADFLLVCLVAFTLAYTRTGGRGTVIPLLGDQRLGLSEGQIGLALTVAALLNLLLLVPTGRIVDHYGRKVAIVPGLAVSALGLALFALAPSYRHYVLAAAILGLGTGVAGPAPAAYVSDILPAEAFGASMGVYRTIMDVGMVAGPVIAGAVADLVGLSWALAVNACLMATTALLFAWKAPETARQVRQEAGPQPAMALKHQGD